MNTMYRLLIADDALDELECIVFLISKFKLPLKSHLRLMVRMHLAISNRNTLIFS